MAVRVGIIGCGAIAQRRHVPETVLEAKAQLVAVADPNLERAQSVARQYSQPNKPVTAFADYREMLASAELDAVVVCSPNAFHAPQTIAALSAGKHVLVEKPMAGNLAEAKAMLAAAKKAKKFLMVGQNQRLMPPHAKAKQILDTGKLGRPLVFRTVFHHGGPEYWSLDGKQSWFFDPKQAVMGVCGDLGVHKADLMRYLLGEEIVEVAGFLGTLDKTDAKGKPAKVDDNAFMTMRTKSGVLGTMTISWTNYGKMEDNSTLIFCEKGVLKIGADKEFGVIIHHNNGKVENIKTGAIATNTKQTVSGIMSAFIKSITTNTPPIIDGSEGYKSLAVICAALESAKTGKAQRVQI